jgi:catalase
MAYYVDDGGENPHVNYEPSSMHGLKEAPKPEHDYSAPVNASVVRSPILRTADDYTQAGERFRTFSDAEREELLNNVGGDLAQCPEPIALRMVWHLFQCDERYGSEVARRAGVDLKKALALEPLAHHPGPGKNRTNGHAARGETSFVGEPVGSD